MPKLDFTRLLTATIERKASDLHLTVGDPPMIRLHGSIMPMDDGAQPLTAEDLHASFEDILTDDQRQRLEREKELDFALEIKNLGRFRVNVFYTRRGEGAAFRYIPYEIKTMKDLGLPEETLRDICNRKQGLVLVTGPTGSGKSTTLATMIDYINSTRRDHIITAEDPIEFVHEHKKCLVNQREVGSSTHTFANALRSALREDPDVILVGEMRDLETISLALTAAETGHLVFATLHTISAPKTVDRVIDVFPAGQQPHIRTMFAEVVVAIISQVLLKNKEGSGRVAALEIMLGTPAIKSLIREGKVHQIASVLQTSQRYGMQHMDQVLKSLVITGKVDVNEAKLYATNLDLFADHIGRTS